MDAAIIPAYLFFQLQRGALDIRFAMLNYRGGLSVFEMRQKKGFRAPCGRPESNSEP